MRRVRSFIIFAVTFVAGGVLGFLVSQYGVLAYDFSRAMLMRSVISEMGNYVPLRLLDLYEIEVNRQDSWPVRSRLNWNEERIEINLRRYVRHLQAQQRELAEDDLARAARLRKHGVAPSSKDLDFERELANKLYGPRPSESEQKEKPDA